MITLFCAGKEVYNTLTLEIPCAQITASSYTKQKIANTATLATHTTMTLFTPPSVTHSILHHGCQHYLLQHPCIQTYYSISPLQRDNSLATSLRLVMDPIIPTNQMF